MKYLRYFFIILLLLFLLTNTGIEVLAMDTGFTTEALPKSNIETFIKNINISILPNEPKKKAIECFDINDNGLIAIGYSDSDNKTVCIYTSNGDFQYGYNFKCSGKFGIELDENTLNIYFVRSDIAITVNPNGEIEGILQIQDTIENNSYWNNSVFLTRRNTDNNEYILKNDMGIFNIFTSSYSQLIALNANGEESIIYDVNSAQFTHMAIIFIGIIVFICIVAFAVIKQFIKRKPKSFKSQ